MKHSLETVKHSKKSARLKRELLAAQRSLASGEAKFGVALEGSRWLWKDPGRRSVKTVEPACPCEGQGHVRDARQGQGMKGTASAAGRLGAVWVGW